MADSPPAKRLFGLELSDLTKAVLGLFAGAAMMFLTTWYTEKLVKLSIVDVEKVVFRGDKTTVDILTTVVKNEGNIIAEDVRCDFEVKAEDIKEVTATKELSPKIESKGDKTTVQFSYLNPGESLQVSIFLTKGDIAAIPVKVRAKGANGVFERNRSAWQTAVAVLLKWLPVLSAFVGIIVGYFLGKKTEKKEEAENVATIVKAIRATESEGKSPLEQILATAAGDKVVGGAARHFAPNDHFTRASLAQRIGAAEKSVFAWIRSLGTPEKRLNYKVFDKHDDGSYSLSPEKHAEVLRILQEAENDE